MSISTDPATCQIVINGEVIDRDATYKSFEEVDPEPKTIYHKIRKLIDSSLEDSQVATNIKDQLQQWLAQWEVSNFCPK